MNRSLRNAGANGQSATVETEKNRRIQDALWRQHGSGLTVGREDGKDLGEQMDGWRYHVLRCDTLKEKPTLGRKFKISVVGMFSSRYLRDNQEDKGLEVRGAIWAGDKRDMKIQMIYEVMGVEKIFYGQSREAEEKKGNNWA